jgi:hypothetical protein
MISYNFMSYGHNSLSLFSYWTNFQTVQKPSNPKYIAPSEPFSMAFHFYKFYTNSYS